MPDTHEPTLAYRDNLFFDRTYLDAFLKQATPARVARSVPRSGLTIPPSASTRSRLSTSYTRQADLYLADLWYYPGGPVGGSGAPGN